MEYTKRVSCFIDLLGFKRLVESAVGSDDNVEQIAKDLSLIQSYCDDWLNYNGSFYKHDPKKSVFSDCIAISINPKSKGGVNELLLYLYRLQAEIFYKSGILLRGGVAFGDLYHEKDIVFGPAHNSAYVLESKCAIYPRILVEKEVINIGCEFHGIANYPAYEEQVIYEKVEKDCDGRYFINYLNPNVHGELNDPEEGAEEFDRKVMQRIQDNMNESSGNPTILSKHNWMLNKFIHSRPKEYLKIISAE